MTGEDQCSLKDLLFVESEEDVNNMVCRGALRALALCQRELVFQVTNLLSMNVAKKRQLV